MAEERTLGLVGAHDSAHDPSKEELQRRMDEARDSISNTVTEIKETVANQVQAVKETLDWREQFKKRPVAWSAGAAGVGFLVGYGVAAIVKGESEPTDVTDYYSQRSKSYASQPLIGSAAPKENGNGQSSGPGFLQKLSHTPAFGRVKDEAGSVGDAFVKELGKTATQIVLPALMASLRNFIGGYLPTNDPSGSARLKSTTDESSRQRAGSSYQPTLDRGQS